MVVEVVAESNPRGRTRDSLASYIRVGGGCGRCSGDRGNRLENGGAKDRPMSFKVTPEALVSRRA